MADSDAAANGDSNDATREKFVELCRELNMDVESQDTAWASYKKIDQRVILEVILHEFYAVQSVCFTRLRYCGARSVRCTSSLRYSIYKKKKHVEAVGSLSHFAYWPNIITSKVSL